MVTKKTRTFLSSKLEPWIVLFCAGLFFSYQFLLRVLPNVINEELMQILSIDASDLGFILSFYWIAYVGMQIPLGLTMDRLGPKLFLLSGAVLCTISCCMYAFTTSPIIAAIVLFIMGIGSACSFLGCLKLGTLWFDAKDMGKPIAMTYTLGTLGACVGGTPMRYIYDEVGFSYTLLTLGIIGAVVSAAIYLFVKNKPDQAVEHQTVDIYKNSHPLHDILTVIKQPQAWILFVYSMLMYAPIVVMGTAWGVPFLERAYDLKEGLAAPIFAAMFMGAAMGSPVFSVLSDYFKNRKNVMFWGAVIAFALYSVVVFVRDLPIILLYILMFTAGLAYAAKSISFASICEIMPRRMSGMAIAFLNVGVMSAGIIYNPLMGLMLEHNWDGSMVAGAPFYNEDCYRFALMLLPISLFLSIFLAMRLKETHPESSIVKEYGHIIDPEAV